jgi:hypothetical protein
VTGKGQDAAIYAGLGAAVERVLMAYRQEETARCCRVERVLIDANWGPGTDLVYEFCRRSPHAALAAALSHGKFIGASVSNPMASWQKKPGERVGAGWRLLPPGGAGRGRHVVFDANHLEDLRGREDAHPRRRRGLPAPVRRAGRSSTGCSPTT